MSLIKKKLSQFLLFVIFITVLQGCNKSEVNYKKASEFYDLSKYQEASIEELFESVDLIPLEFKESESYPGSVYQLNLQDSLIFVLDNRDIIHVFGNDGKFKSSSADKRGEGPGEFPYFMGFTYNPFTKRIAVLSPFKILEYDTCFNFIEDYPVPSRIKSPNQSELIFNHIETVSPNYYHLFTNSRDDISARFLKFNIETGKLEDEVEYGDKIFGLGSFQNKNFYTLSDSLTLFIPTALTDDIFSYDSQKDTLYTAISYSLGKDGITATDFNLEGDKNREAEKVLTTDKEIVLRIIPNKDFIIFMTKRGDNLRSFANYFVNRKSGSIKKLPMFRNEARTSPMFYDIDSDFLYAIMEKESLLESPHLLLDSTGSLDSIENESLIVLRYKLKP